MRARSASCRAIVIAAHVVTACGGSPPDARPTTSASMPAPPVTAGLVAEPARPAVATTHLAATTAPSTTAEAATTAPPTTIAISEWAPSTVISVPAPPEITTTTTEPARRRRPSALPPPDGPAPLEPEPAWSGEAALTGGQIAADAALRPALVVKIDNAPGGRPPWNLADADLVIEENVEDITRFVAVYHSHLPDRIGPVRSARTGDLELLPALNRPVLAASGGNPGVVQSVRDAHSSGELVDLSAARSGCFYRSATRPVPHNLLLDPECAVQSSPHAGPARPLFARDGDEPPIQTGSREERFRVRMDGLTVTWVWDPGSGHYLRRQRSDWHTDVDGDVIAVRNVVVLTVEHVPSTVDARSPHPITIGSGPAVLHRDGRSIAGTWSRPDVHAPFELTDAAGASLTLAPGKVFVELHRPEG